MDSKQTVIGVNIEAPKVTIGRITGNKLEKLIEFEVDTGNSKNFVLNQITSRISKLMSKDVLAIGFGIPGALDPDKGIVKVIQRIQSWKNINIKSLIEKEFNIPCFLNNDANCFTLGVKHFGLGKKFKNVVGVILGEGLGAGMVINNQLYSGTDCYAGEFGMIAYNNENFEKYASSQFFKNVHNTSFKQEFIKAENGDEKAIEIFNEYGFYLGEVLENIILTLNPEIAVLGGELSKGFKFFEKSMWARLDRIYNKSSFKRVKIFEKQIDNLPVLGAAALYYDAQQAKALEIEKKRREKAEQETSNILHNVDEGIFLLNKSMKLSSQYSKQLEVIMAVDELSGVNFLKYLKNKISDKDLGHTENYLRLMFDDSVDELALSELNPLNPVQISIEETSEPKFLKFQFKRILNKKGKIDGLFSWVKDITEQKKLEEMVKESEIKAQRQTEMVLSIISVEPKLLQEFIDTIEDEFKVIGSYFDIAKKDKDYKKLLKNVYRSIHLFKGNASILNLKIFAESAHNFEDKIISVQVKEDIQDKDISTIWRHYTNIKNDVSELQNLLFSIGDLHASMNKNNNGENTLLKTLDNYVANTSKDLNKKVKLTVHKFNFEKIPGKYKILTKDLLIQLIRNSITHGLEEPTERIKCGKIDIGNLEISTDFDDDFYTFSVYDDGKGIQIEKLKQKMKNHEDWLDIEIDKLKDSEIIESIFHPGISTHDGVDITSGRGVGLDAVFEKVISKNGTISIETEKSKFCKIVVKLPNQN